MRAAALTLALLLVACGGERVSDPQTGISLRVPDGWQVQTGILGMALWARPRLGSCPGTQVSVTRLPPAPAAIDDAALLDDRIRRFGYNSHGFELIERDGLRAELRHRQGSVAQQVLLQVHRHDDALDLVVAAADPGCFETMRHSLRRIADSYRASS
ncbi:hypothetical protein [Sinimarinibacterium thermocellulolyticum]|uniref:Lipoprotein n=1 Tax=Sinimarinibacterium thermocellulolyticum TaxID=3170016 RepID=A0ABV2ABD7_9GAMM